MSRSNPYWETIKDRVIYAAYYEPINVKKIAIILAEHDFYYNPSNWSAFSNREDEIIEYSKYLCNDKLKSELNYLVTTFNNKEIQDQLYFDNF